MNTPTSKRSPQDAHEFPEQSEQAFIPRRSFLTVLTVAAVSLLLSGCGSKKKDPENNPNVLSGIAALKNLSVSLAADSPQGPSSPNVQQELLKVSLRNSGNDVLSISQLSFSISTDPSGKNGDIGTCRILINGIEMDQAQSSWAVNFYNVNVSVWPGEELTLSLVVDSSRAKPGMKLVPSLTLINGSRPLNSPITGHRLEY